MNGLDKSPAGVIYKTDNITRFSKMMNLSPQAMSCLNKETYCSIFYKGWSIPEIKLAKVELFLN